MKTIEAPKTIEPWRIICAAQSEPDYSEERYILIYAGDGINDYYDKGYILLEGWHCSCYDWPEVDWDATYYEEDELLKIADMRKRNPSDSAERRFFMLVEQASSMVSLGKRPGSALKRRWGGFQTAPVRNGQARVRPGVAHTRCAVLRSGPKTPPSLSCRTSWSLPPVGVLIEPESMRGDLESSAEKRASLAEEAGRSPRSAGFKYHQGAGAGGVGAEPEQSPTLTADWHNPAVYPIDEPITMADLNANTAIGYDMVGTLKVGGDAPSVCL